MATYTIVMERDPEDDAWLVHVRSIPHCHTYGRSIKQAATRIREALGLYVDDADDANLEFDIRLPSDVDRMVGDAVRARREADEAREAASAALEAASAALAAAGISRRDAGVLLGISHQRVQQLIDGS